MNPGSIAGPKRKVPLVAALIVRQPIRTITGICGIALACLLMFVQLGFRDGLFNQSVRVHHALITDLVVINRDSSSLATMRPFPGQRLGQIYGDKDVVEVNSLRIRPLRWRNQLTDRSRNILAIGVNPNNPQLDLGATREDTDSIKGLFNVLFDADSRKEFGPIATYVRRGEKVSSEVNGYRLNVSGLISIGPSFAYDGYIVASRQTVEALITDGTQGDAELGLVTLKEGSSKMDAMKRIQASMPEDVKVLTKQEYIEYERNYWRNGSSIGFVFNFGTLLGLVVGATMIYQVLYTDVTDHLPEYATLRAMGYNMGYLYSVVIRQGMVISLMGYIPSLGLGTLAYVFIRKGTNIGVEMTSSIMVAVFVLSIISSSLSAILVTRRLWAADPAEIF